MMATHILLMLLLIDGGNAVRRVLVTGANKGIGREICSLGEYLPRIDIFVPYR
jgi:hypothetical protein